MHTELKQYRQKPPHINIFATDSFNMRITPHRKEMIKQAAISDGVSMTVIAISALDLLFATKHPQQGDWLNW